MLTAMSFELSAAGMHRMGLKVDVSATIVNDRVTYKATTVFWRSQDSYRAARYH